MGRQTERKDGRLQILEPGEQHKSTIQIDILENAKEIETVRSRLEQLKQGNK
jgi:hypothetical protein